MSYAESSYPEIDTFSSINTLDSTTDNAAVTTDPWYIGDDSGNGDKVDPKGAYKPTSTWNLSTKGVYSIQNSVTFSAPLYTNYLFTGSTTMGVGVRSNSDDDIIVHVYKKGAVSDTEVTHFTVPANSYVHRAVNGLNASSKYYVRFGYPSSFTGYVNEVVLPYYF